MRADTICRQSSGSTNPNRKEGLGPTRYHRAHGHQSHWHDGHHQDSGKQQVSWSGQALVCYSGSVNCAVLWNTALGAPNNPCRCRTCCERYPKEARCGSERDTCTAPLPATGDGKAWETLATREQGQQWTRTEVSLSPKKEDLPAMCPSDSEHTELHEVDRQRRDSAGV